MKLIGVPCACMFMRFAITKGDVVVGTATDGEKSIPFVGVVGAGAIEPFQYCPWCGNAAIEIKETE